LDDTALMRGAIRGMVEALDDPHTSYMTPEEYDIFATSLAGEFEGIGAMVELSGDYLRIVSPFPGSPAEQAGIRSGDLVIRVDDVDLAGQSEAEMISRVRGPAGTTVHLSVQRETEPELLEFDIVRAKITIPSVESKMLEGNLGYVKINDFGEKTPSELREALQDLLSQNPSGLVLDLRGNPGGYLTTAVKVTSQFVGDGLVLRERFGDGREETYAVEGGGLALDIPLVVLINPGSASASEIVAGAIQDHQRGQIVGETSYGKGSVQTAHTLSGDNGEVRFTIAKWFTPDGRSIHGLGITPDIEVVLTDEDRDANRDPQLEKAMELLGAP
jgi:carboxyl-terminal processing protease